jgi:coiled-coil-helix-coiled-coil-helix domain-containing protein 2
VAVGSSIGHAIGGFFGGGSSSAPAEQQQQYQQPADNYAQPGGAMDSSLYHSSSAASNSQASGPCAMNIKSYTDCMTQNQGDMNICGWYLDQLKACQAAAKQY